jgi:hypothetical protein
MLLLSVIVLTERVEAAAADFTGVWHRTNIEKTYQATIVITNQTKNSFDFEFMGFAGGNTGELSATAIFTGNNKAVCKYKDEYHSLKVEFILKGGVLEVQSSMEDALGFFGVGVIIDGEYIKGEPAYANANIVNEILGSGDTLGKVKKLLGKDAFDVLVNVMEDGSRYDSDDLTYTGSILGAGRGVDLLVSGDKLYCLIYDIYSEDEDPGYTFYTNDSKYSKDLPPFMAKDLRYGVSLKFIYRNL